MNQERELITLGRYRPEPEMVDCTAHVRGVPVHLKLDLSRPSERYIHDCIEGGDYERQSTQAIARHLKPGGVFFDVGAHVGYFSAVAKALMGKDGMVVAFEPDTENGKAFLRNCPHCLLIRSVVYDLHGQVDFYINRDNDGGHCLWNPGVHPFNAESRRDPEVRRVRSCTLDDFSSRFPPTVIKIDTEGAEVLVLCGAPITLKQKQLTLVIAECNEFGLEQLGCNPDQILSIMREAGFKMADEDKSVGVSNLIFER